MGSGSQLSREFTSYYKRFALERGTTKPPDEPPGSDDAPDGDAAEPLLDDDEFEAPDEAAAGASGAASPLAVAKPAASPAESRLYRAVAAHVQVPLA
jgi:hypothetical protein